MLAGGVYAANTVGAILGSLVASFVLIPWIGSQHATQVLVIVSAVAALLMLEPSYAAAGTDATDKTRWNSITNRNVLETLSAVIAGSAN